MATYRLNPNSGTDGTGTTTNPWNTLVGKTALAEGDTLLIDTNTTYAGNFPTSFVSANRLTIGEYGTGNRPIIDMGIVVSPTPSGTPNIWSVSFASNVGGNVSVDGLPMSFVEWDTDIATTAATMGADSFSFDPVNFILYIKPANSTISGKVFKASTYVNGMAASGSNRKLLQNIEFRQASKHAFVHVASYSLTIENCIARHCGGYYDTGASFYAGNGFEFGNDCIDILVNSSEAYDTFDSPFTSQGYGGQLSAMSARNHEYNDCIAERYGYAAFEFVTLSPWQTLNGVWVNNPYARDGGTTASWSGDRNGKGDALLVYSGAAGKGGVERVYCNNPDFERQKYGVRNQFTTTAIRVDSGRIIGSETAWASTEQLGTPIFARAVLAVSNATVTDGTTDLAGGFTDSLVRY
jgi:hypothetical protein